MSFIESIVNGCSTIDDIVSFFTDVQCRYDEMCKLRKLIAVTVENPSPKTFDVLDNKPFIRIISEFPEGHVNYRDEIVVLCPNDFVNNDKKYNNKLLDILNVKDEYPHDFRRWIVMIIPGRDDMSADVFYKVYTPRTDKSGRSIAHTLCFNVKLSVQISMSCEGN